MNIITYRPEIDGIRAIAVVSVILYHMDIGFASGGYVGVDIFFVLSGYLIAAIMTRSEAQTILGVLLFLERRVRRIAPLIVFLVLALYGIGYYIMPPRMFLELGKETAPALFLYSNFYYYLNIFDYFGATADQQMLLHTWSLSIEMQFYAFAALFFIFFKTPKVQLSMLIMTTFGSLLAASIYVYKLPPAVFFGTPFRLWEFGIGALCYIVAHRDWITPRLSQSLASLGTVLIIITPFFYGYISLFPGWSALLPTLATALILQSSRLSPWVALILTSRISTFLGRISYSLYLWHWPIIQIVKFYSPEENLGATQIFIAFAATFLTSIFSYKYVEKPFRQKQFIKLRFFLPLLLGVLGMLFFFQSSILQNAGLPSRFIHTAWEKVYSTDLATPTGPNCFDRLPWNSGAECQIGDPAAPQPTIAIIGDSMANLFFIFNDLLTERNEKGVVVSMKGCAPILSLSYKPDQKNDICFNYHSEIVDWLKNTNIEHVVLTARWPSYMTGAQPELGDTWSTQLRARNEKFRGMSRADAFKAAFREAILDMKAANISISIIEMYPVWPRSVPDLAALEAIGVKHNFTLTRELFLKRNKPSNDFFEGLEEEGLINFFTVVEDACPSICSLTTPDGFPLNQDTSHPSRFGMTFLFADGLIESILDAQ